MQSDNHHVGPFLFAVQRRRKLAVAAMAFAGSVILVGVLMIIGPIVFPLDGSLLMALTSDTMILVWLSGISCAHLVFVSAFCVAVAASDRLWQLLGLAATATAFPMARARERFRPDAAMICSEAQFVDEILQ